ncbi:nuclear pore complex-interacting protein family member B4-like isoform X11 [Pongo pygmaeus]|uniref:nuclear pore complex-interacting protein family member B4-like isoform X10 n=1 Tax=Pongo pygmaeus TaxID=9600 RepID=UPI0023E15ED5|nr:nuclear pore complex-interacting protein family member B4-like isoform X11 [Pongo pygmaeus]XP_054302231.1 nuclear pore complex-interacting protein family member B4-like isoform X12 [Pongo pygmaeus]
MPVWWLLFWLLLLGFISHHPTYVSFLKTVLKSQNVHDGSTDVQRKAWRSNSHSQEGIKIGLEDLFTSQRHMEAKVRAEVHKVTRNVNSHYKINGHRKTAKKKKLFQRMQELRWRAEDYYRCKITPSARKPLANSLCAQALQRGKAERKAAYKQHRCQMRQKKRVPERHMSQEPVQGRLGLENPFSMDSGPHSVPMRNSNGVPAENTEKTKVRMVAVEHHHSSGLRYRPYLPAETLRKRIGRKPPPPIQCDLRGQPRPSVKGCLRPLTLSRLQCPLGPQPHSTTDDFLRRETPQDECALGPDPLPRADDFPRLKTPPEGLFIPISPSPVDDSLSLKTPPECLLVPLPPSPVDDFLTPQAPPIKRRRLGPVAFPRADDFRRPKEPPDCFFARLPPSPVDDSLSLKTPPECLLVPLPPSPVDDFLTPQAPPIKRRRLGPVAFPRADDFRRPKEPPDCFFACLPPSPVDDSLSLKTPPECLLVPLPPPVDDFLTPQAPPIKRRRLGPVAFPRADDLRRPKEPPDCFFVPLPPSPVDDSLSLKTPPECLLVPLPPPVDDFLTPQAPPIKRRRLGPVAFPRADDFRRPKEPPDCFFARLPPSPVDDSLSLKTPPECLLVPLPPPVDDFLTPQAPPIKRRRLGPVAFPRADDFRRPKEPPDCFFARLPPSPVDDSLSLKTPPECLLVPLPPPVDDFLTPQAPPIKRRRLGPVAFP